MISTHFSRRGLFARFLLAAASPLPARASSSERFADDDGRPDAIYEFDKQGRLISATYYTTPKPRAKFQR